MAEEAQNDEAQRYIELALQHAEAFDKAQLAGAQVYHSLFANRYTHNPQYSGKNWEGTQTELIQNKLSAKALKRNFPIIPIV
jgi:hypothetical protein